MKSIFKEIIEKQTDESKLLQALDKLETVLQHNEAPIETWLPLEYDLQLTYGQQQVENIFLICVHLKAY
ncbi:MAG: HD domain-containing protein [Lachnoclostridium sp.]